MDRGDRLRRGAQAHRGVRGAGLGTLTSLNLKENDIGAEAPSSSTITSTVITVGGERRQLAEAAPQIGGAPAEQGDPAHRRHAEDRAGQRGETRITAE